MGSIRRWGIEGLITGQRDGGARLNGAGLKALRQNYENG